MELDCTIELEYKNKEQAAAILASIGPDNAPYAQASLEDNKIVINASASLPLSLLHTMEDLLSCVKVAEEATNIVATGCPLSP